MNNHAHLLRRSFKPDEKVAMVKAALGTNRPIAEIARRFDVNQNQLTRWIREYRNGASWRYRHIESPALLPVKVTDTERAMLTLPSKAKDATAQRPSLKATLEFESGVTLELDGLSGADLKMMLEVLR